MDSPFNNPNKQFWKDRGENQWTVWARMIVRSGNSSYASGDVCSEMGNLFKNYL